MSTQTKEQIYNSEISPLIAKIIEICDAINAANAHFRANRTAIDRAAIYEENKHRLATANSLTRELHGLGICVQHIDISVPRPRLYLRDPLPPSLPLAGIIRRRVDSEVFECSAILDDCEVMWAEFDEAA